MSTKIIVIFADKAFLRDPSRTLLNNENRAIVNPWRSITRPENTLASFHIEGKGTVRVGDIIIIKDKQYILPQ